MIQLTIDGRAVSVPKGTTVYQAAKGAGIELPIFCYQDRMPPFGACRVCLVEVEKMGKLQTSCTLEATEGMVVRTQSDPAVKGRKEILEFLLINHPLDCPICDRGGECPLQDQALSDGPGESRFYEEKRHFTKPRPLGPVLMLDRERCIACARCTRFGEVVAGDEALQFIDRGYKTEVGTANGEPVDSKFISNTIQICPVGALTSQVYRFRARPWDNEAIPSACTLCPVGCSRTLDSRDGEIIRTRACENKAINDIWLCDKGAFGYEHVTSPARLKRPLIRKEGRLEEASWEEAFSLIAAKIKEYKPSGRLAGWGGNPLTVEESYLFQKVMRETAGVNHVDHRLGEPLFGALQEGLAPALALSGEEMENLSFALLLGVDLTEEFPVLWLRLKQGINKGAAVSFIGHFAPEIGRHLSNVELHPPGEELNRVRKLIPELQERLERGEAGALFVGRQYLSSPDRAQILMELSHCLKDRPKCSLSVMEGRGNSRGARFAGMRPDLGPGEVLLEKGGKNSLEVLEEAAERGWDFLWVAGANPAQKFSSRLWSQGRSKISFLLVQDLFLTDTAKEADVVLPTLSVLEKKGSFITLEGRVQKLLPGRDLPEGLLSDEEIFRHFVQVTPKDRNFFEELQREKISPVRHPYKESPTASSTEGDLKATFAPALFDEGVRLRHNAHLARLVKPPRVRLHPSEGAKRGLQEGDKVQVFTEQATHKGSFVALLSLDPGVAEKTLVIPLGFDEIKVHELGDQLLNGLSLNLRKVGES